MQSGNTDASKTAPAVAHATFAAEQATRARVRRTVADARCVGWAELLRNPSCDPSTPPDGQISKKLSSPLAKNISLHPDGQISGITPRVSPTEGRIASRHGRGMGCGGRGSVGAQEVIAGQHQAVSDRPARRRTALQRLGQNFDRPHTAGRSLWSGSLRTAKSCGSGIRC
jgi:hypothetical protein